MIIPSETTRNATADHRALLRSIDSSMGTMTTALSEVQQNMSESVTKLEMVWRKIPTALGCSWGPELPILLLDGLGRNTPLPMMFVETPEVRIDLTYQVNL